MTTNRIIRIIVGLLLIGYAIYSGNVWFYLGLLPLITGLVNWCPLEMKMGTCDPASGCCSSTPNTSLQESACCAPTNVQTPVAPDTSFKAAPKDNNNVIKIEILGTGCSKCLALENVVKKVTESLEGSFEVKKVSDLEKIMAYNVVSTPGLVIDGKVVSTGKLLNQNEVIKLLKS